MPDQHDDKPDTSFQKDLPDVVYNVLPKENVQVVFFTIPKEGKKIHLLKKAESLKRALYALDAASATTLHLKYIYTSHTLKKKTKKMRHSIKKELLGALFECSSSSGSSSTGQQSLYIKPPSYVRVCVCRPSL